MSTFLLASIVDVMVLRPLVLFADSILTFLAIRIQGFRSPKVVDFSTKDSALLRIKGNHSNSLDITNNMNQSQVPYGSSHDSNLNMKKGEGNIMLEDKEIYNVSQNHLNPVNLVFRAILEQNEKPFLLEAGH